MKGKRGLSPVVSVLLLILIAVAAAVIIYSWFSGAASKNPTNTPQLYERIKIEAVNVNMAGSTKYINVTIRNIGSSSVNISSVYIISASTNQVVCENTGLNFNISVGSVGTANVTCTSPLTPGTYTAKVVTKSGITASYTFTYLKG